MDLKVLLSLCFAICCSEAYKVLVLYPLPLRSVTLLGEATVKYLLEAGHEVTFITTFPSKEKLPKNYREIDISDNTQALMDMAFRSQGMVDFLSPGWPILDATAEGAEATRALRMSKRYQDNAKYKKNNCGVNGHKTIYLLVSMSTTSQSPTDSLFTKCCCCIPLRIGCFILGYLNLIFNTYHTLALLTLTTYIGITTHGFDHFDSERPRVVSDQVPDIESVERPFLNQIGILLMVILCANIAWLMINVACLVGLHKKNPGPIRIYIGFATARLLLSLAGFVYLVMTASTGTQTIIIHSMDLGLAAYFILVYYIYAIHLEREMEETRPELPAGDIAFVYPVKIDKEKLVL